MRRFCLALLLLLALPLLAVAEAPMSEVNVPDWAQHPHYTYRLEVYGYKGDTKEEELIVGALSGFGGVIERSALREAIWNGQGFLPIPKKLFIFEIAGLPPLQQTTPLTLTPSETLIQQVAHRVSCGEVNLYLYMPHCDRFEARLYRTYRPSAIPDPDGRRMLVSSEEYPWEHFATLSGSLQTRSIGRYLNPRTGEILQDLQPDLVRILSRIP